jgi:hypothetical protein
MTSWKVKVDITQRSSDNNFAVWEQMPATVLQGGIEKNWTLKRWVLVAVFKTKGKATDYCTKRFGRNCFKTNEAVTIVFV